jgi:polyhydroxyalkanoate synthesis repressor PhaR
MEPAEDTEKQHGELEKCSNLKPTPSPLGCTKSCLFRPGIEQTLLTPNALERDAPTREHQATSGALITYIADPVPLATMSRSSLGNPTPIQITTKKRKENMRTIKRYSNRKLYDTREKHYTSLNSVAQMIRQDNEDLQVVNHASGQDLTAQTLAQIISEEEKKAPRLGVEKLTSIIRSGIIE